MDALLRFNDLACLEQSTMGVGSAGLAVLARAGYFTVGGFVITPKVLADFLETDRVAKALDEYRSGAKDHAENRKSLNKAFKEESDVNVQSRGDFIKRAGANAIGAVFVFLHLLKGHVNGSAKLGLAQTEAFAANSYKPSHMNINWVGGSPGMYFSHETLLPHNEKTHHNMCDGW